MEEKCAEACPTEALKVIGREIDEDKLLEEILKDEIFYENSRGGVTFSGGEPLMQTEFLAAVLEKCRTHPIHTVVDTCGYASFNDFKKIMGKVDLFFYDLKMMDPEKHNKFTGVSNQLILGNLMKLAKSGNKIHIRIPLIPGINDSEENAKETADFIKRVPGVSIINLLPYHRAGTQKYLNLKRKTQNIPSFSEEKIKTLKNIYEKCGFSVKIGG